MKAKEPSLFSTCLLQFDLFVSCFLLLGTYNEIMAKILMIEDDPLVSRMYTKVFRFEGIDVEVAKDGQEGIDKAKTMKPDLIFCDVMMPRMNGIQVLETLKSDVNTKDIPMIMLTNLSGTHDAENAVRKGAAGYMVKSEYRPKEIAQKAKQYLQTLTNGKNTNS